MFSAQTLMLFLSLASFRGDSAVEFTRKIVALGPRPVASPAHLKVERLITAELRRFGCAVEEDVWTAQTPAGPKRMNNIVVRVRGASSKVVVLSGHYDTKVMPGMHFVGANDGGSSAGFLLEMARATCGKPRKDDLWLVWLDGEEALRQRWSAEDSLYGSRRLAARWDKDGTAGRIKALINVDMIGDRDLALVQELNSDTTIRNLIWKTASELGYARHFPENPGAIEDDHIPFLQYGIPAVDLIDFDYGPGNSYWHTEADTMDKLSARSFQVIGDVLSKVIEKLESR